MYRYVWNTIYQLQNINQTKVSSDFEGLKLLFDLGLKVVEVGREQYFLGCTIIYINIYIGPPEAN